MPGAIQFVGDSSQLSSEAAKARQSVSSVAASAEDARKRIVASYQQQIEAAKKAGASQNQLESITRKATQRMADATDDNARRYINAIDRMEDRTKRFNAARTSLATAIPQQPVSQFTFGGNAAKEAENLSHAIEGVGHATGYAVAPSVRFGSVLRGMEGGFSRNIRAAEYFGASLSFLEPLMASAFPIVGAATLGAALFEMGKHAYEAFENIVMLKGAIEGLNQLQISVANTVGKNNDSAESSVESILEATQGRAAALKQKYSYQSQKPLDLSSYFYSDEFKKLPDNVKGNYEKMYKSVAPADIPDRLRAIKKEIVDLTAAKKQVEETAMTAPVSGFGAAFYQAPTPVYDARMIAAKQIQQQLESGSTARSASLQSIQTSIPKAQEDEAKKNQQEALSRSREATAARKQSDQLAVQNQEASHLEWMAALDRSKLDEVLYWSSIVALTDNGSARALDARKKYQQANVALNREQHEELTRAIGSFSKEYMTSFNEGSGLSASDSKKLDRSGGDASNYIASLRESIDLNKQSSDAIAENSIQMAVATGQMSKLGAARAMAALHQQQYADSLRELQDQREAISNDPTISDLERKAQLQGNSNQVGQLNTSRSIQSAQDQQSVNPAATSMLSGASDALTDFVIASRDGARMMRDVVSGTLRGLNQSIVNGVTGGRTDFGRVAANAGRGILGAGLNAAEGSLLGNFGKLGTKGNPMAVQIVGSAAGGIGSLIPSGKGIIGGLLKSLPFLASGGDFSDGAVVGENGPELLSGSGHVTNNKNLRSMLSGGSSGQTINYSIDARGTDAVLVGQYVRTAIVAAHQSSVTQAVKQVHQDAASRPVRR